MLCKHFSTSTYGDPEQLLKHNQSNMIQEKPGRQKGGNNGLNIHYIKHQKVEFAKAFFMHFLSDENINIPIMICL